MVKSSAASFDPGFDTPLLDGMLLERTTKQAPPCRGGVQPEHYVKSKEGESVIAYINCTYHEKICLIQKAQSVTYLCCGVECGMYSDWVDAYNC